MDSESKSDCRSCPIRSSCRSDGDGDSGLSGWSLAGQAAAYFLLPVSAAIAAAAAVNGENMRIAAGVGAFVVASAAAAIIGLYVRRRRKVSQ
ncbi:MAG: hypothetical protein K8R91_02795 [Phycisphaerae bacterium]|nr:hypothetical protein [Phycisphaerae bacterium]